MGAEADPVVGAIVQRLRVENGLSREKLAAAVGLDESTLTRIEDGSIDATWGMLRAISAALHTSIDRIAEAVVQAEASGPSNMGAQGIADAGLDTSPSASSKTDG